MESTTCERGSTRGAGGIRTLDRALQPYNGLANRRLQPLGHSSLEADMPDAGATRKRQFRCREANKIVKSVWLDIGFAADAARAARRSKFHGERTRCRNTIEPAPCSWSASCRNSCIVADCVFSQTYNPHSRFA